MMYRLNLDTYSENSYQETYGVGGLVLEVLYTWDTYAQEQYDMIMHRLQAAGASTPVEPEGHIEDYLTYLKQWHEWYTTRDPSLYQTLTVPLKQYKNYLAENQAIIDYAASLSDYYSVVNVELAYWDELLRWRVTIRTAVGTRTAVVEPSEAWFYLGDAQYSFRFTSTKDRIGREDMRYVTFWVWVPE